MNILHISRKVGSRYFLQVTEVATGFHLALFRIGSEDGEFMALDAVIFTEFYPEKAAVDTRVGQIERDVDSVLMEWLL